MKAKYFLQENRFLLKFFAAKSPWTVLYFVLPLLVLLALLMREEGFSISGILIALPLSFLYWSLVEYLIHRCYFHWLPKNEILRAITGSFHLYHHEHPSDLEVINSGWVTGVLGAILHFSIFYFVFQASYLMALELTFALIIVYYAYEWIHYLVHQKIWDKGPMNYLQNFHLTHHVSPKKNFGQITPIWDYVCGTVRENLETRDNPRMRAYVKGADK